MQIIIKPFFDKFPYLVDVRKYFTHQDLLSCDDWENIWPWSVEIMRRAYEITIAAPLQTQSENILCCHHAENILETGPNEMSTLIQIAWEIWVREENIKQNAYQNWWVYFVGYRMRYNNQKVKFQTISCQF